MNAREKIADEIFGTGFLTQGQREEVVKFETSRGYVFTSRRDLAYGVTVVCPRSRIQPTLPVSQERIAEAVTEFIGNFCTWTYNRLNGFSGFDTIYYIFEK